MPAHLMRRHTRGMGAVLFALAVLNATPAQAQDPAATGPYAVSSVEYTQGNTAFTPTGFPSAVEVTAVVFHPTNLAAGPFPLVLFMHGRHATCTSTFTWPCPSGQSPILSYRGYDYSAQQLASHGYIVVSVGANGINAFDNSTSDLGARARAELIDRHLQLWRTFNTTGAPPFGTQFVGRVDLTRVGTMGHSRGGEGVLRHFLYNASLPAPFPIKVVLPIAPTNFSRWQVGAGVHVAQLLPYCDGDVSDLQGVHAYDDVRYSLGTTGSHSYVTVMGANHNFFNSIWTPGLGPGATDDWSLTSDPFCGTGAGNGRLTAAQQRSVGQAYLATYFRTFVGGETPFFGYADGSAGRPPSVATLNLHTSYHGPDGQRRDINRLLGAVDLSTNFLGGQVSQTGLSPHDLCGGTSPQPQHCLISQTTTRQPHTTPSALVPRAGLSQLRTGWSAAGAGFTNDIPVGQRDVSSFAWLQFRATVNFTDARNAAGQAQDLSVVFTDDNGASQALRVGQFSSALFYPPGNLASVPKVLQNTVRLPLSALTLDKTRINRVRLAFDQRTSGALLISDLHFYRGAASVPPNFTLTCSPTSLTLPRSQSRTTTCTVASTGSFASAVTLSCANLPAGVTCAPSPNPVTPAPNGTVSSSVTFSAASSATVGAATVQVTGVAGTLTRAANVTLNVTAPLIVSIDGDSTQATCTAVGGTPGYTYTWYVTPKTCPPPDPCALNINGEPDVCCLAARAGQELPVPCPLQRPSASIICAETGPFASNPANQWFFDGTEASVRCAVADATPSTVFSPSFVPPPPPPNFTLVCGPSSLAAAPGGSVATTCTVYSSNAFASPVTLSCASLPAGVSCSPSPNPITPPAGGTASSSVTFTASTGTALGSYAIQVNGTGGGLTRSASLTLAIQSLLVASISGDAAQATCSAAGGTPGYTYTWYVTPKTCPPPDPCALNVNGEPDVCCLAARAGQQLPLPCPLQRPSLGVTCPESGPFTASPGTQWFFDGSEASVRCRVTDAVSSAAFSPSFVPPPPPPNFTLACSPSALTAALGGSVASTCTVYSSNAFASPVTLSCGSLPAGVSCASSPNPVTPPAGGTASSSVTFTASAGTALGSHAIQVSGTGGGLTRSASLTLTVSAGPLAASISVGASAATCTASGGAPPYTYRWYVRYACDTCALTNRARAAQGQLPLPCPLASPNPDVICPWEGPYSSSPASVWPLYGDELGVRCNVIDNAGTSVTTTQLL